MPLCKPSNFDSTVRMEFDSNKDLGTDFQQLPGRLQLAPKLTCNPFKNLFSLSLCIFNIGHD